MKTLSVIAATLVFSELTAIGCFSTPQEQIVAAEDLVQRTSQIVLARVVEAKADFDTGKVTYSFLVQKLIKGKDERNFSIIGHSLAYPEDINTFDDHRSKDFWESDAGRCRHDTDCKIHPSFAVGQIYLIFVDQPYHGKSFEHIQMLGSEPDTRDRWLDWVEKTVKAQQGAEE